MRLNEEEEEVRRSRRGLSNNKNPILGYGEQLWTRRGRKQLWTLRGRKQLRTRRGQRTIMDTQGAESNYGYAGWQKAIMEAKATEGNYGRVGGRKQLWTLRHTCP